MTNKNTKTRLEKIARLYLAFASIAALPSALGAATPWVPFELSRGHIMIDAVVDGHEGQAIVDSGANVNLIDEDFLREFGRDYNRGTRNDTVRVTGIGGTFEKRLVFDVPAKILGAEFELDGLVPGKAASALLLLGTDFFARSIVQIDYPNTRLRMIERDSLNLKKFANAKIRRIGGQSPPEIRVRLNDEMDVWLTLDTGATGGLLLRRDIAERHGWLDLYPTVKGSASGVNRTMDTETFNLPQMRFGPYTLESVVVTVPAAGERLSVDQGLLGYDVLRHFQLTMDIRKRRLHIEAVDVIDAAE